MDCGALHSLVVLLRTGSFFSCWSNNLKQQAYPSAKTFNFVCNFTTHPIYVFSHTCHQLAFDSPRVLLKLLGVGTTFKKALNTNDRDVINYLLGPSDSLGEMELGAENIRDFALHQFVKGLLHSVQFCFLAENWLIRFNVTMMWSGSTRVLHWYSLSITDWDCLPFARSRWSDWLVCGKSKQDQSIIITKLY